MLHHRLCSYDRFLVLSSDGLYQYFSNEEVVAHVAWFMENVPEGDPAQDLIAELLIRAAKRNGQLMCSYQDDLLAVTKTFFYFYNHYYSFYLLLSLLFLLLLQPDLSKKGGKNIKCGAFVSRFKEPPAYADSDHLTNDTCNTNQ